MQRDRAVGPRIVELMAAVAADHDFDAQPPRGFSEAARLVAQLAGQEQQPRSDRLWEWLSSHAMTAHNRENKAYFRQVRLTQIRRAERLPATNGLRPVWRRLRGPGETRRSPRWPQTDRASAPRSNTTAR